MAEIFPAWSNKVPVYLLATVLIGAGLATVGAWYYFSPEFTDVGYQPDQPVPFSHSLHAGELEIDCRYCHSSVEVSAIASVPPTQACMNCHKLVARDSQKLVAVRQSFERNRPLRWVRVHKVPEYAYFNHGVHVRAGVGCQSCHGKVTGMEQVQQVAPLSMGWCLGCHRAPEPHLRPEDQITNMSWTPTAAQLAEAEQMVAEKKIHPPTDCSACHR